MYRQAKLFGTISKTTTFFLLISCLVFGVGMFLPASAQTEAVTDTTVANSAGDSLKTLPAPEKSGLEGPIKYTAHEITFSIKDKKSYLSGDVHIEYQDITLDAGKVTIDWNKSMMIATGIADTTDSLGNPVYKSLPEFKEKGNEPILGSRLEYDFKNQRGKVFEGKTKMEPGYYRGEQIDKIGKNTLLVKDGYFTSCDSIDHPDYYFKATDMRILVKKRAVARPIYMYIADVPVFALPFGIFPMERGRRSGIRIPTYGISSYGGKNLRHLGYYWAASQYWDATMLVDFYERTGTAYEGQLRYRKRYNFNGNVDWRYAPKDITTGQKLQRWSINFNHAQTIGETITLNARGSFTSDRTFLQDFSHNLQDRLNQILSTNVAFSKRWPNSKNSLSIGISRNEYLQTGNLDYTLPNLRFYHSLSSLFKYNPQKSNKRKWYHDLSYDYNSNIILTGSKTLQADSTFKRSQKKAWQHKSGLSFNSKIFKYVKYNQSASFEELWVPEYMNYTFVDSLNQAVPDTVKRFRARHTFGTSISASTTLYGLYEIPFSPLKVIRHKMDPRIGFSFSPDFSSPEFGYVQTFRDSSGRTQKYDHFAGNPFGGTSSSESRRMTISITNLFQGKMIRNGEEKKIDLFTLNFNSSYNFLADSLKWSSISSSLRAQPVKDINLSFSATHSLYKFGHRGTGNRNEYVWQDGFSLPRLLRAQLNAGFHLAPPAKKEKKENAADSTQIADSLEAENFGSNPVTEELSKFELPWDLTANLSYSVDRSSALNVRKIFSTNISARLEITPKWRVQYSANLDLINKQIDYQSFNIYRDLHCWEMSFSWAPNPQGYSFFTFEIRIKESALKDIKLTKSSAGRRPFGG